MSDLWPDAPVYTLLYDRDATQGRFAGHPVRTSVLQRLGVTQSGFRRLLPLYPAAVERIRLAPHDLLLSSSSAFAHGLRPGPETVHICYCHSPFRYVWHEHDRATGECFRAARPLMRSTIKRIQRWDRGAAARVDHYIANSRITQERMFRFWGREAAVVHPPVDTRRFRPRVPEDYLLTVSELVAHKRLDIALEAAGRAGQRIKVVGTGPERERLMVRFGATAEFLGRVDDDALANLYAGARAVVIPNVEEFGIVAVEAQAAGRPVVAADGGGARETVVPGRTGILVPPNDVGALAEVLREEDFSDFDPQALVINADRFSAQAFRRRLIAEITRLTGSPASAFGIDPQALHPDDRSTSSPRKGATSGLLRVAS
jgi:glycosyltransferase involved in cell wall biosynthesis